MTTTLPPWVVMWAIAFALYGGCKWLTYRTARAGPIARDRSRALGYLFAWPGMDAAAFLSDGRPVERPSRFEWVSATLKTISGAVMIWFVVRKALSIDPLMAGWVGMVGATFILHFGTFHLASLYWRSHGVDAMPLMRNPMRSTSLAEFWGRRWNTGFHELASRFTFRPLQNRIGRTAAALLTFLVSGLVHELVISVPARGAYGWPTAYFVLQGLGIAGEKTAFARRLGLAHGWRGWLFMAAVVAGPAFWLFPPVFVRRVILPMLAVIGAT